jgi:alanyl aminopeptidase
LRGAVLDLLAWAQDPAVVKELTRLGLAYAGLADRAFHPEVVDPDVGGLALSVAVEHGDSVLFDALATRLETLTDGDLRERTVGALGSVKDPTRVAKALALSVSSTLRKQEAIIPLLAMSEDPRTRDAAWAFTRSNYAAISANLPEVYVAYTPYVVSGYCDAAHADEAAGFFAHIEHAGLPKAVRQRVEAIRLCAAQASSQTQSARTFFKNRTAKAKVPSAK